MSGPQEALWHEDRELEVCARMAPDHPVALLLDWEIPESVNEILVSLRIFLASLLFTRLVHTAQQ